MDFMEQTYQRTGLGPNWDGLGRGLRETTPPVPQWPLLQNHESSIQPM